MKSWLQARRFFIKIFTFTISLLLIMCFLFTGVLYSRASKSVDESIYHSDYNRNLELLNQTNIYWNQLVSIGFTFANIDIPYDNLSLSKNYWARITFNQMILSHVSSSNYITNIDVAFQNQSLYPSRLSHEVLLGNFSIFEIYREDIFHWPYEFDLISLDNNQYNRVTITLRAYDLSKQIFTNKENERQDYLLTPDNIILLTNQSDALFQNIDNILPDINITSQKALSSQMLSYKDYYYILSNKDKYGFRLLSLVPKSHYSSQYTRIQLQTLLMSGCLFLVALLISVFLTMRFYRPIQKTVNLLLTYIPDDLYKYESEISFIHQSITKYISKDFHSDLVPKTLSRIQNAQTAVQQYQINSHFLFNTLENIKAISINEIGVNNRVENSIMLLNDIIREGVYQKNIIVSLSHELHLLRCYLELMQIRYPNVSILWFIDEALSQCQVFKFTLQPMLENCFTHAFKGIIDRPKTITISTQMADKDLLISIQDNGLGIDQATLCTIKQKLTSPESEHSSQHIGIYNVHKRITDVFGQHYGISLSSTSPGTIIEIRYPIIGKFN